MKTEFLPDAEDEFLESSRYYESKAPGVGIAFITEVHNAVSTIVALPNAGEQVRETIRIKALRHFPYDLIYSIENDLIIILAVAHHKRRPMYWHSRPRNRGNPPRK